MKFRAGHHSSCTIARIRFSLAPHDAVADDQYIPDFR